MEYDASKNAINIAKHGLSFEQIGDIDWGTAITREDIRYDYGEVRYLSYAKLDNRICALVWTERDSRLRPISFRKANARERKIYEEESTRS